MKILFIGPLFLLPILAFLTLTSFLSEEFWALDLWGWVVLPDSSTTSLIVGSNESNHIKSLIPSTHGLDNVIKRNQCFKYRIIDDISLGKNYIPGTE